MLPVLRIAALGETRVPEVAERLANEFDIAPEERNQLLPSGRQRLLHNRIHWAKFYMSKAGLIASPRRGRFVASELGRSLLASNPERIDVERLLEFPSFKEFYRPDQTNEAGLEAAGDEPIIDVGAVRASSPQATPEEQIEAAY
jgi:restriction system protein